MNLQLSILIYLFTMVIISSQFGLHRQCTPGLNNSITVSNLKNFHYTVNMDRNRSNIAGSSTLRENIPDYAVGIDLGTTNSCVGVYRNGHVEIIANKDGDKIIPSYVAYSDNEQLIGYFAKTESPSNPKNTIYDAKRMIGKKFNDSALTKNLSTWNFEVVNSAGNPKIRVTHKSGTKLVTPEEVSASILKNLRGYASTYLDQNVTKAVITVPAYFNDSQRQATIDAGKIAGFEMLKLINEPTAAAIAHGFGKGKSEKNILVYDLGGGTFDVSILTTKGNKFDVRAVNGDTDFGGRDLDNLLLNYVICEVKKNNSMDLSTDNREMANIQQKCEVAKENLSSRPTQKIQIQNIKKNLDVNLEITRSRFESLCEDLFENTLAPLEKALSASKLSKEDIHEVVLVGGSTRIPKVQSILQEFFDGKKLNKTVNPDEAVACGAAIMAAGMSFDSSLIEVSDVIPIALGVNNSGGLQSIIIPSNTKIPVKKTQKRHTVHDFQKSVRVIIQEGESKFSKDTKILGEFRLKNITLAPARETKMNVTFEVDSNGILHVSAIEPQSKSTNQITIESYKGRLSQQELNRMTKEMALVELKN